MKFLNWIWNLPFVKELASALFKKSADELATWIVKKIKKAIPGAKKKAAAFWNYVKKKAATLWNQLWDNVIVPSWKWVKEKAIELWNWLRGNELGWGW